MSEIVSNIMAAASQEGAIKWVWLGIGFAGQALFFARFLVQWLASERAGKSYIPISFWYFSLGGSLMLLSYAIFRADYVFIAGQSTGSFIYVRNLMMIAKQKKAESAAPAVEEGTRTEDKHKEEQ